MFDSALRGSAQKLLRELEARSLMMVTAESCTGGLISALLTEIPGSSAVVERAYVTYSNKAKDAMPRGATGHARRAWCG